MRRYVSLDICKFYGHGLDTDVKVRKISTVDTDTEVMSRVRTGYGLGIIFSSIHFCSSREQEFSQYDDL